MERIVRHVARQALRQRSFGHCCTVLQCRPAFPQKLLLAGRVTGVRAYAAPRVLDAVSSSGVIIDPYLSYYQADKSPRPLLSLEGVQERWRGVKSKLSSGVSFGHISQHLKSFDRRAFPKTAQQIFVSFHEAFEKGDLSTLAAVSTDDFYVNLRAQIKMKSLPKRKVLRFLSFTVPTVVVHGRHMYSGRRGQGAGFGQITCVLTSRREEYEVDSKNLRVKDTSPVIFENESICVFEVAFGNPNARWRLANIVEQQRQTNIAASQLMTSGPDERVTL